MSAAEWTMRSLEPFLEKLGYTQQMSSWDRGDLSRMTTIIVPCDLFEAGMWSRHFERVVNDQDVWIVILTDGYIRITHAYVDDNFEAWPGAPHRRSMAFDPVFEGPLRSQEELVRVMDQLGCPYIKP